LEGSRDARSAVLDVDRYFAACDNSADLDRRTGSMVLGVRQQGQEHLGRAVRGADHLDAVGQARPDVETVGPGAGEYREEGLAQVEGGRSRGPGVEEPPQPPDLGDQSVSQLVYLLG
jgi:hypothetical protein